MRQLRTMLRLAVLAQIRQLSIFQLVSALIGAVSIFSMLHHVWEFGVSSVLGDLLEYYRALAHSMFGWVGWPYEWRIPLEVRELFLLQLLCSAVLLRSGALWDLTIRSADDTFQAAGAFAKLLLVPTPLGILVCYSSLLGPILEPFADESSGGLSRRIRPFVFSSVVVLVSLFAVNAYGVTIARP